MNYGYLGNVYMSRASPDSYPVVSVSSKGIEGVGFGNWRVAAVPDGNRGL